MMIKYLSNHPEIGFISSMASFAIGIRFEDIIEVTTPYITWFTMIIGLLLALLTLIAKAIELKKKLKP